MRRGEESKKAYKNLNYDFLFFHTIVLNILTPISHQVHNSQIYLNPLKHFKLSVSIKTSEFLEPHHLIFWNLEPQHDWLIVSKKPTKNDKYKIK